MTILKILYKKTMNKNEESADFFVTIFLNKSYFFLHFPFLNYLLFKDDGYALEEII